MTSTAIHQLVSEARVIILLGPGGVGKTTSSIALALLGARLGRRVGLLSIDPAKRLADALGLSLGAELRGVPLDKDITGTPEAAMIDQKAVFDQMVHKHASSKEAADKILAHPLYQAASSKLAGPLEYMALAKLEQMIASKRYDLVILDTPPDTHALEFLERPNLLAGFREHRVMNWLIKPFYLANRFGIGHVLSAGERLMGGVAKVTGLSALQSVAEFLFLMQQVIEGFQTSGEKIVQNLRDERTRFVLVAAATSAVTRSATNLGRELIRLGYRVNLVLQNRTLPPDVAESIATLTAPLPQGPGWDLLEPLWRRQQGEKREISALRQALPPQTAFVTVAESSRDLHQTAGLWELVDALHHAPAAFSDQGGR